MLRLVFKPDIMNSVTYPTKTTVNPDQELAFLYKRKSKIRIVLIKISLPLLKR